MFRRLSLAGAATCALASAAHAQDARPVHFDIPAGDLGASLNQAAQQSHEEIVFDAELARGRRAAALRGDFTPDQALDRLLAGTGLSAHRNASGAEVITKALPLSQSGGAEATLVSEVVVTAQKKAERLMTTPAPVTALLASRLQRQEANGISDYAAKVPGLNFFSDEPGQLNIIMRGVSTGSISSSTTGIYIDGAPFSPSTNYQMGGLTAPDLDPGSLQRIEVLRGPQGTLYGASAMGGLISFVPKLPSLNHFSGRFETDASTVDGGGTGGGVRALIDGPLIADTLGFTLSAYDRVDPGYIDNPLLGKKNVNQARVDGARIALLWRPSQDLTVELSALMHDSYSKATSDEELDANLNPIGGPLKQYRYIDQPFKIQDRLYIGKVDYNLGWAKLTSITSYQTLRNIYDSDYTTQFGGLIDAIYSVNNAGAILDSLEMRNKFAEELRLASSGSGPLEWQGGLFFTREDSVNPQVVNAFDTTTHQDLSLGDLAHFLLVSDYSEYASFGDVTWHFTPQFSVMAGLRFSYNEQYFREPTSGLFAGGTNLAEGRSHDSAVTYLLAPKYQLTPDAMIYGRIASGYRPGGPNDVNPAQIALGAPQTFKPDSLVDYEVGYKATVLNHTATVDLSVFDIEWRQIQMIDIVNGLGFTSNGQNARSTGFEAAGTWSPIHGLTFGANLAWTDAYLTGAVATVQAPAGSELPYVPRFAGNLSADWDFPIAEGISGFIGGDFHYQGDRASGFVVGAPVGFQRPVMAAYRTLDLRTGIDRGGLEIEVFAKNVGDSHGINTINSLNLDGVSPPLAASVIQPRTFGVSVVEKF